ncbi:hypothetical protein [Streptomyces sp. NPDC056192]|uniref:hypothetical protein n=1 Tax=Streptomyces sp. NPDC056192 TaxID=3345743 RepID=UPI0035D65F2D
MDFDLTPPTGVGPLRIGMTRHAANTALDSLRDFAAISESDRPGQHVFRLSGLMISIHCVLDEVLAVAAVHPGLADRGTGRAERTRSTSSRLP